MSIRTWILAALMACVVGCSGGSGAKGVSQDPASSSDGGAAGSSTGAANTTGGGNSANQASASTGGNPTLLDEAGVPVGDASDVVRTVPATLVIHDTSRLTIGTTLPEFAYKGGENKGTLYDHGDGTATVFFPAKGNEVTPLEVIPGGLGEVQIEPNDMTGQIDFCTGIMTMPFDAQFTPVILGMPRTKMHVVTDLTTETSMGMDHTLMGKRVTRAGDLKLVGIAVVPKTNDASVDGLLGLPTDAQTNMDGTLTVEGGFPECPPGRTNMLR